MNGNNETYERQYLALTYFPSLTGGRPRPRKSQRKEELRRKIAWQPEKKSVKKRKHDLSPGN